LNLIACFFLPVSLGRYWLLLLSFNFSINVFNLVVFSSFFRWLFLYWFRNISFYQLVFSFNNSFIEYEIFIEIIEPFFLIDSFWLEFIWIFSPIFFVCFLYRRLLIIFLLLISILYRFITDVFHFNKYIDLFFYFSLYFWSLFSSLHIVFDCIFLRTFILLWFEYFLDLISSYILKFKSMIYFSIFRLLSNHYFFHFI